MSWNDGPWRNRLGARLTNSATPTPRDSRDVQFVGPAWQAAVGFPPPQSEYSIIVGGAGAACAQGAALGLRVVIQTTNPTTSAVAAKAVSEA